MNPSRKFYSCKCFFNRNIFVKKYRTHFVYNNDEQFRNDYREFLKDLEEKDVHELIQVMKDEVSRRRRIDNESRLCRDKVKELYKPLSSRIFHLQEEFLQPSFIDLCHQASNSTTMQNILPKLDVISKDKQLYGFPLFTPAICEEVISELENFEATPIPKNRPNSMNRYGILLEDLGLYENFVDPLREKYLAPLAKLLFPDWCGESGLDSHRAFTVHYEMGKDVELDSHYDNAEVTLNVCLGKDFSGGELYFDRMRTDLPSNTPYEIVPHKIGYGVLHRGQQLHGTMPITNGQRHNFIVWMRSSSIRNNLCPMCDQEPDLIEADSYGDGFVKSVLSEKCSFL